MQHLIFWAIIFLLGALVGERYGLPTMATGITDRGFEMVEGWVGQSDDLSSEDEDAVEPSSDDDDSTDDSSSTDTTTTASSAPASGDLGNSANAGLKINAAGLQIIKDSEGLRLEAYNLGGQWLIGYGHSRTAKAGMTITDAQAEQLLREDVGASEDGVRKLALVPVNQNQFSAMVSLAYNLGIGGFGRSTVLSEINGGDYSGAADAFLNHNKAGGKVNEHLTHRREQERALFLTAA